MTYIADTPAVLSLHDVLDIVEVAVANISRCLPSHVSREDLASAGRVALVAAFLRMQGESEEDVRAYCFSRVRGAILDELRRADPLSRGLRAQAKAIRAARASLTQQLARSPSVEEVASHLGFPVTKVIEVDHALEASIMAEPIDDSENLVLGLLEDELTPCPSLAAEKGDIATAILEALSRMPPKQAHAVRRYHLENAHLDQIASELSVSRERARQLREAGEKRLRADLQLLSLWNNMAG